MATKPQTSYPDFKYDLTKGQLSDELGVIQEYFGPSKFFDLSASSGRPVDSTTLAYEYSRNNEFMTNIVHFNFVNGTGWMFALAPPGRTKSMNKTWTTFTWERHAMEPAPEDTTPRYVTHSMETQEDQLTRFNIGATMRHDLFKRPEGRVIMENNYSSMISGGWITAKLVVGQAVINGKLYWQEWHAQYGTPCSNVMDAMRDEIDLFGALSKDEKGIYKLHHHVEELVRENGPKINMIVLAKGSLNFLSASGYETEAFRRGEAVVQNRLSLGAKSMTGLFPGITIFEDEVFSLQNIGPDEINVFTRTAMIGRYFMVDGSDFGANSDNYNAKKHLSVKAASMDIDAYKEISIATLIDKCLRWGGGADGDELTPLVQGMVDFAEGLLQRSGIRLHDPELLDPYVWRDESYAGSGDSGSNGYHVIQHWGDMDKHYFTVNQNIIFGQKVAAIVKKELKSTELDEIRELKSLRDRLYDVDDILNESVEGYFTAIAGNPENQHFSKNGTRTRRAELMLKANRHGAVQPPHISRRDLGGMPNGALYVVDPVTRVENYVWAVYPENAEKNADGSYTVTLESSDPLVPAEIRDAMTENSVTINVDAGFTPIGQPGYPAFYVLAPRNAFGTINAAGESQDWTTKLANAGELEPISVRATRAGVTDATTSNVKGGTLGIRNIKLVTAPAIPLGYGIITGLRTLAELHAQKAYRGWDEDLCMTAWKGVRSLDRLAQIMIRISPKCELLSEKYTAAYMLSPDKEKNALNNIISNLWDTVKYPVWVRQPGSGDIAPGLGYRGVKTNIHGATNIEEESTVPQLSADQLDEILRSMGFEDDGSGGFAIGKTVISKDEARRTLREILQNGQVDSKLYHELTSVDGKRDLVMKSYASKNGVGHALYELLGDRMDTSDVPKFGAENNKSKTFAVAFVTELVREKDATRRTHIFNVLLGHAFASSQGPVKKPTKATVASMLDKARAFQGAKKRVFRSDFEEDVQRIKKHRENPALSEVEGSLFVNTRLAINGKVFEQLAEMAESDNRMLYRVANSVLRPSDPANPHRPLAAVPAYGEGEDVENAARATVSDMTFARTHQTTRLSETVFGKAHLISERPKLEDPLYRGETHHDIHSMKSARYSPYKRQPQHMPPTLVSDPDGPLYAGAESVFDREGRPIADTERIKEKKWLVFRFEEISRDMESDDIGRMGALMLCLTRVSKSSLLNWVKEGLTPPDCCYIIAQPWIRIRMSSGLWAQGGVETAETGYNYEDVVLQFNGKNKTWHMHYTLWLGCFIYQPQNYVIMKDIKFEGYLGGMDDTFNDDPQSFDTQAIDWATVRSSFVFSCGATFSRDLAMKTANPLCLYGKYDPKALPYNFANRNAIFSPNGPLYPSFPFYEFVWGFTSINAANDVDQSTFAAIRESTYIPGIMPMANHKTYNEVTKDFTTMHHGSGHLDPFEPPMLQKLNGKITFSNNRTN